MRWLLLVFLTAGCSPDGEPTIRLRDQNEKSGSSVHGQDKPLYREVTDEFGVAKGWKF